MRARIFCVWLAGVGLLAPLAAQSGRGCQNDQAKVELNRGVGAFKEAEYAKAVDHFRTAVYMASAYMQQYIPGAEAPENQAMAAAAKRQFDKDLEQEPDNELAMASLASLCFNQKKLDEATTWYKRLILVRPDNKEAFYTMGVIAWTRSLGPIGEARQKLGMKPDEPGPIKSDEVRVALRWMPSTTMRWRIRRKVIGTT